MSGIKTPDEALREAINSVGKSADNDPSVLKFSPAHNKYYFADQPDKLYTTAELADVLTKVANKLEQAPAAQKPARPAPGNGKGNGNGKSLKAGATIMIAKESPITPSNGNGNGHARRFNVSLSRSTPKPINYRHTNEETINLQASTLLPNSEKLLFIDPKAVELMPKATPKVREIVEKMSTNNAKKPIDPRMIMVIAVAVVLASIALVIIYNQWIKPAQEADRAYQLELLRNGGNATAAGKPPGSGGGGLFKFEPPNPFAPAPIT